jgi:putative transposase
MKQLQEENWQLKKLVADLSLDKQMLQDVVNNKALKPARRRLWADKLRQGYRVSERQACAVVKLLTWSYRYQSVKLRDSVLRARIN